jgi:1-phosphatidylinositol-4-phosphate 5-kinase
MVHQREREQWELEQQGGEQQQRKSSRGDMVLTGAESHISLPHAAAPTTNGNAGTVPNYSYNSYSSPRYSSEQRVSSEIKEGLGGRDGSVLSVPERDRAKSIALSMKSRRSATNLAAENAKDGAARPGVAEEGYFGLPNGKSNGPPRSPLGRPIPGANGDVGQNWSYTAAHGVPPPMTPNMSLPPVEEGSPQAEVPGKTLKPPVHAHYHRASSPPAFNPSALGPSPQPRPDRLTHRHTLEVPKLLPGRSSAEHTADGNVVSATGRFSPNTPTRRRASLQLGRRQTRSIHSEMHMDDIQPDEDAARWAEVIRQRRIEKRARQDTDDERVVVGTKVDSTHVNYAVAYNMLTGIRFVVSRNNAKLDRAINDADFNTRNKHSFDITGSELTPSTKYDFKFKDYAPWVFRHIRQSFQIDPAEYLMSLTSKYILSELGSPGKSGSFFYFSRDYKYIIKTIHHSEHKFLRKILKDYYNHVIENTNTLLSQFYGLHRVKMPYGRKIHFVVMNNLFPPHRDIHRTFDLKGSTIGRDFKEEDLEHNPRATLKDLNWLRRNLHLEFGPTKKDAFVAQMQKDVALLQRLKIMDYSLLVGIHDLERGNEENLRDKTLHVFQPGGEKNDGAETAAPQLTRTPSKMENAKRAKELREMVKKQRPVPMDQTLSKMPDEAHKSSFYFYADDGGFRATHEDDMPGEEIYYLGIIDCLTRVSPLSFCEDFRMTC